MAVSARAAATSGSGPALTLGPLPFLWPAERKLAFYARIADEAPIDTVYLGEVVCSKRAPFFEPHLADAAERLERGGKRVVLASLAEVMLPRERQMTAELCATARHEIEVNDGSALLHMSGRPHRIGPMMNVYNEQTLAHLAARAATHVTLPVELPGSAAAVIAGRARELGVGVEMQVFGRASLAVSARCYHARAHGRTKDNCQFVCEQDPDGMPLRTLGGKELLAINGIQTLSHAYVCLLGEIAAMTAMGIGHLRLMPHTIDMVAVADIYREVADRRLEPAEGEARLRALGGLPVLANGFWHGRSGHLMVAAAAVGS